MSASGIIGTFLGVRSPGTAYVLLHHYMGEIDGAFRSWGFAQGRHRRHLERHRRGGAPGRRRDSDRARGRAHPDDVTDAPPESCSRTAMSSSADARAVERRSAI